jgi:hypothetical protein
MKDKINAGIKRNESNEGLIPIPYLKMFMCVCVGRWPFNPGG